MDSESPSTPRTWVAADQAERRNRRRIASAMNARASIDSTSPRSAYTSMTRQPFEHARHVREVVREHLVLVELVDVDTTVDDGQASAR